MFNPDFLNTIIPEMNGNKTRTDSKDVVWTASKLTLGVIILELVSVNCESLGNLVDGQWARRIT
jgi:hypothetical protein